MASPFGSCLPTKVKGRESSMTPKGKKKSRGSLVPYFVVEKSLIVREKSDDGSHSYEGGGAYFRKRDSAPFSDEFEGFESEERIGVLEEDSNLYAFDQEEHEGDPDLLLELEDDSEDDLLDEGLEQVGGVSTSSAPSVSGDSGISNGTAVVSRREKLNHPPRIDAHRLSRANLEDTGDLELDAILNELCALETQFTQEISSSSSSPKSVASNNSVSTSSAFCTSTLSGVTTSVSSSQNGIAISNCQSGGVKMQPHPPPMQPYRQGGHTRTGSGGAKSKFDAATIESEIPSNTIVRTDSPDNDSAFSDNVSMLSSESSASSGASGGGGVSSRHDANRQTQMDQAARAKAEKIKMALEKLKEAQVKKLFIKAFSADGSSKSLLVDEKMSVAVVTRMLADKNHVRIDPKWAIVEHLPDLYMERIYEDDEMLVDNLLLWTRDSKNKLLFQERLDKYDFFIRPEKYLTVETNLKGAELEDDTRTTLIEECFSNSRIPDVEGPLFLKSEGKKAWKKFYFVLRQSGLYYCPKGKSSKSSKDLVCLATFDSNQVYHGFNWKKKYKAPSDFGFALKHPHLQAKNSKLIKYLCAEDSEVLSHWITGIRIAKSNQRLLDNYRSLVEDIAQEDIDMLASSRSFSVASVSGSSRGASQATTPSSESRSLDSCLAPSLTPSMCDGEDGDDNDSSAESSQDTPVNTLSRAPIWRQESMRSGSSSSSSGCLSERSSAGTPTGEHGFESDFPQGTIKRKPSGNPKLPLTSTTRHLVKEVDIADDGESSSRSSTLRRSTRKSLTEEVNTLRRRNSSNQSRATVSSSGASSTCSSMISSVPSVPANVKEVEELDSLPLPPPPTDLNSLCDAEILPPPPPELLASTLSLNSLPPPPDEESLLPFNQNGIDLMTASITSLPPPPPPPTLNGKPPSPPDTFPSPPTLSPPVTPPKPKNHIYQALSPPAVAPKPKTPDSIYACRSQVTPTIMPVPTSSVPVQESSETNGWGPGEHQPILPPPMSPQPQHYAQPQKSSSPQKKVKKITFMDDVQNIPPSPPSPAKPLPPRRAYSTRLSNPGRLDAPGCKITPPRAFLNNLQRVMQRKWHVAQKCQDFNQMPHEVLGFRDPLPQSECEKNVGAWIQEHYGSLYENLSPHLGDANQLMAQYLAQGPAAQLSQPAPAPSVSAPCQSATLMPSYPPSPPPSANEESYRLSQTVPGRKKLPPPPPPKRADTTQLSGRH